MTNNNSLKSNSLMMRSSAIYSNFSGNYNPNDNFLPLSTSFNNKNYNKGYEENVPILNRQDYKNQFNVLHNNISDMILNEHVVEYKVKIDAFDRDATNYPNPFDFAVHFGTQMEQTKRPVINRSFKNVKYVKIDTIIIPKYYVIVHDVGMGTYSIDGSMTVNDDRFVYLEIPELQSTTSQGTNTTAENAFVIMQDREYPTQFQGSAYFATRIYKDNVLQNIDKLTFRIKDSYGNQHGFKIVDTLGAPLNEQMDTNIDNKNKLNNVYNKIFQTYIHLTIGVVENAINTLTKFEK